MNNKLLFFISQKANTANTAKNELFAEVAISKIELADNNTDLSYENKIRSKFPKEFGKGAVLNNEIVSAWLENINKHYPYILDLDVDQKGTAKLDYRTLHEFMDKFHGHTFRLAFGKNIGRISYIVNNESNKITFGCYTVEICNNEILIYGQEKNTHKVSSREVNLLYPKQVRSCFEGNYSLPIEVINIGSCFSRSIFRSDDYFNPEYKKYFHVGKTLFHDSLISLFSKPVKFDYSNISDLQTGDAKLYVGIEFEKNVDSLLSENAFSLAVIDNYIDATVPVFRFQENSWLTYNKYISESVFKRFISDCEILYPGSESHQKLYRYSVRKLRQTLKANGIENTVLIGGRLSKYRIEAKTAGIVPWSEKLDWIIDSNNNWELADLMFLEEFPEAIYIDMRKNTWLSAPNPPMIGGASPSHYQSEFYRELFQKLLAMISRN